jgi:Ca-activated chloride channel family protein
MKLYLLIILATPLLIHPFSYDSAIYAAQKGDMQRADEQLKKMVVNAPDKADVLYDSGVITHGLKNTNQAAAYFARAAECAQGDKGLCVRAHFNAGNACVDNKNLQCALEHYDKALALEPDNEYVRHNRDRVAQMLQEQEQQKDQQHDKDEKDDQKKDQDDEKDDKDQQQNDQQDGSDESDDQKDQQQQDGNDDQQQGGNGKQKPSAAQASADKQKNDSSDNTSDQESDQQPESEQGDDSKAGDKDAQRKEQGNREKNKRESADQKKRDSKDDLEKGSQDAKAEGDKKQGEHHGKTPEQENKNQDKKSIAAGDGQEQGKAEQEDIPKSFGKKIDDPWLASILDDQELRDKAINKQLMEAKIRQNGGKHGQNCW